MNDLFHQKLQAYIVASNNKISKNMEKNSIKIKEKDEEIDVLKQKIAELEKKLAKATEKANISIGEEKEKNVKKIERYSER
ncbi:Hypothetical protein SRAE_X000237500 [Strongyloides ratti]|uniref:Uncharacterized protein n=1 Tax=Strongyloides ratti TaxID=34506 RepID=A0A090KTA9_STRRB|nr:Hypothetical protein SRAE_X000237500 [Strongyloides ratti]CEF60641.1 Hypothetical protein SRAE_X000237500 [Strongyloides ratti]